MKKSSARPAWVTQAANYGGTSLFPYSANVVWQDTTSNATYCSANAALGSTV